MHGIGVHPVVSCCRRARRVVGVFGNCHAPSARSPVPRVANGIPKLGARRWQFVSKREDSGGFLVNVSFTFERGHVLNAQRRTLCNTLFERQ
jgi:hypothetical protein